MWPLTLKIVNLLISSIKTKKQFKLFFFVFFLRLSCCNDFSLVFLQTKTCVYVYWSIWISYSIFKLFLLFRYLLSLSLSLTFFFFCLFWYYINKNNNNRIFFETQNHTWTFFFSLGNSRFETLFGSKNDVCMKNISQFVCLFSSWFVFSCVLVLECVLLNVSHSRSLCMSVSFSIIFFVLLFFCWK